LGSKPLYNSPQQCVFGGFRLPLEGGRAKYIHLLEDNDVKRWYNNVARGSTVTADVYLRRLGSFCAESKVTPAVLATTAPTKLDNLLMDYVSAKEKEEYAGSYVESTVKAVKSWLAYNGVELKRKIKIRGANDTPSLRDERVPTKDELHHVLLSASKQARVASILVAHGGLRLESIGDYKGQDGLTVRDLPELKVDHSEVMFETVPSMVVVRPSLSKARHQYFTFLTEEACGYIKDYLEERIRNGEKLDANSAIVRPKVAQKPFIRSINIGDMMRSAIRAAGYPWRPYVLRSYFDTQLMLAESKGLVVRDYRTFWMGHKGDIENRYTTNKRRLPEDVIESMREAYKRSQQFLQTTRTEVGEEKIKDAFKKQLLAVAGFTEEEIAKQDLAGITDQEFNNLVRRRLLGATNGSKQRVVTVGEMERYLAEGWEYVASIPNDRAIVKMPV
jgi:integrase